MYEETGNTMPILPDLVRGDHRVVGDFLVDVRRVDNDAFWQHHGPGRVHV